MYAATLQFVEPVGRSRRQQDHAKCSLAAGAEYMSVGNMRQTLASLCVGCTISVNSNVPFPCFTPYLLSWKSGHK